jgi:hypothetical protein
VEKSAPEKSSRVYAKVEREGFLHRLDEVRPGLAYKEIQEQTSCFCFTRGRIITFSGEVACSTKSGLPKEAKGAVQSKKFLEILRALPDETVGLQFTKQELVVVGKNKRAGIPMEREILLPVDVVDKPEEWKKLSDDFTDAVGIVQECAVRAHEAFSLTCIHIHPKWMEAFDNTQLTRYVLDTGVTKSFLVKKEAIKYVPAYDFTHIAETGNWLHFKSNSGTIMSIQRYVAEASDYMDLTESLKVRGTPTVLPKALGEAAQRAEIMSSNDADKNLCLVEIRPGALRITGRGDAGWYQEVKRLKYDGVPMKFMIAPGLLVELTKRHTEVEISKKLHKLKVDGGKFCYVVCLRRI